MVLVGPLRHIGDQQQMKTYDVLAAKILMKLGQCQLIQQRVRLPTGTVTDKFLIHHPGAVVIIPRLADGSVLLVEQYRHAVGKHLLEFPAGTLEPDEDPLSCAQREIVEEVGYTANRWKPMGELYPVPGFCDEIQYCFVAEELTEEAGNLDEDEILVTRRMTIPELEKAIAEMRVTDGKTLALFARARLNGVV